MKPSQRRKNLLFRIRPVIRWILTLRSTPRAIAGGLGLGTFVAFTPTMGIQLILAALVATIFSVNRPAALIPVWITNPLTVAPIYTFNYWVGTFVWSGPRVSEISDLFVDIGHTMSRLEFWEIREQFLAILAMGPDILLPLIIGSAIIGLFTGLVVYLFSFKLLHVFFSRRAGKHILSPRKPKS